MSKRSLYTKKLGAKVASSALFTMVGRYHVISGEAEKWSVVLDGSVHPVKSFSTEEDAVDFAKQSAEKKTGDVIIHDRTGLVKDMISFAKN